MKTIPILLAALLINPLGRVSAEPPLPPDEAYVGVDGAN